MKLLGETLTVLLVVTFLTSVATFLMGLFYFFDLALFELWIIENIALFLEVIFKSEVEFRIFNKEDHC